MPKKLQLWLAVAGLLMGACAPEVTLKDCYGDDECAAEQRCTAGKCVARSEADAAVGGSDATVDGPDAARADAQVVDSGVGGGMDARVVVDTGPTGADAGPVPDASRPPPDAAAPPPDGAPDADVGIDQGIDAGCPSPREVAAFGRSRFGCGVFGP